MAQNEIPLASIFQMVAQVLSENQAALNQADTTNGDHGDNMVETFRTIASTMQKNRGKPESEALAQAAKQLGKSAKSGSGRLYAEGLARAAKKVEGKQIDSQAAMQILQTMIGAGQGAAQPAASGSGDLLSTLLAAQSGNAPSESAGADLLSSLLGGLAEAQGSAPQQPSTDAGSMLGSLLGQMSGEQGGSASKDNGLDMGDVLNAGLAFLQARQSGGSNMEALVKALCAASGMGESQHRAQSTQLVVNTFLQAISSLRK